MSAAEVAPESKLGGREATTPRGWAWLTSTATDESNYPRPPRPGVPPVATVLVTLFLRWCGSVTLGIRFCFETDVDTLRFFCGASSTVEGPSRTYETVSSRSLEEKNVPREHNEAWLATFKR